MQSNKAPSQNTAIIIPKQLQFKAEYEDKIRGIIGALGAQRGEVSHMAGGTWMKAVEFRLLFN